MSDLAERVAQVRPLEVRKVPNAVYHGGTVDVALGVVVTDVRHVRQPFPVERALLIRGESDRSGKGGHTGDRGRMSMRDGGGEGRFIRRPGGVAGPQKAEHGGSGGRCGTRRVGRASGARRRVTSPRFAVTVDAVLMTILRGELRIFLVQRGTPPHQGEWALPGGLVMQSEVLEAAALRMVREGTGIAHEPGYLEQLGAYGHPARDPRTRVVTIAYWAAAPLMSASYFDLGPGEDSSAIYVEFVPVPEIESGRIRLAFDHGRIVADALDQVRSSLETTTLARRFCPPQFTISQTAGSVRGRVGHPVGCGELSAQDLAERGVRGTA